MGLVVVGPDVIEPDVSEGGEAVLQGEDRLADANLDLGPEQTHVVVEIAGELALDVAKLGLELGVVEFGLGDGKQLEVKDAFPFEIGAFGRVADEVVGGIGVVVGAVLGEVIFKFGLVFVPGVGAKGHVFEQVGDFVDFGSGETETSAEEELEVHNSGVRNVDKKPAGAVFELNLLNRVFHMYIIYTTTFRKNQKTGVFRGRYGRMERWKRGRVVEGARLEIV